MKGMVKLDPSQVRTPKATSLNFSNEGIKQFSMMSLR